MTWPPIDHSTADEAGARHSTACARCPGHCCKRFNMFVPIRDGKADFDLYREFIYDRVPSADREMVRKEAVFMAENFYAVADVPVGGRNEVAFYPPVQGHPVVSTWLTCKKFKGGKCTAYEDRPHACRVFVCDVAREKNEFPGETGYNSQWPEHDMTTRPYLADAPAERVVVAKSGEDMGKYKADIDVKESA